MPDRLIIGFCLDDAPGFSPKYPELLFVPRDDENEGDVQFVDIFSLKRHEIFGDAYVQISGRPMTLHVLQTLTKRFNVSLRRMVESWDFCQEDARNLGQNDDATFEPWKFEIENEWDIPLRQKFILGKSDLNPPTFDSIPSEEFERFAQQCGKNIRL